MARFMETDGYVLARTEAENQRLREQASSGSRRRAACSTTPGSSTGNAMPRRRLRPGRGDAADGARTVGPQQQGHRPRHRCQRSGGRMLAELPREEDPAASPSSPPT